MKNSTHSVRKCKTCDNEAIKNRTQCLKCINDKNNLKKEKAIKTSRAKPRAITISKTKKLSAIDKPIGKKSKLVKEKKVKSLTIKELDRFCEHLWRLYIRHRDKGKPCISCGRANDGKFDCGHFISRRITSIRWEKTNVHLQCPMPCNRYSSSDTYVKYRKNMVEMYGVEHVEWLESQVFVVFKESKDHLATLIGEYLELVEGVYQKEKIVCPPFIGIYKRYTEEYGGDK